jgi:hypothetical protein
MRVPYLHIWAYWYASHGQVPRVVMLRSTNTAPFVCRPNDHVGRLKIFSEWLGPPVFQHKGQMSKGRANFPRGQPIIRGGRVFSEKMANFRRWGPVFQKVWQLSEWKESFPRGQVNKNKNKTNSVAFVRKRTISTERLPLVREVTGNLVDTECRVVSATNPHDR